MGKITPFDKAAIEEAGAKLTAKQRRLVDLMCIPGTTQVEAAIAAGFKQASAHVSASRILRLPHVVEYIDACVRHGTKLQAIQASMVVRDLSTSAKSDYVRLQAAQDILDRAGHKAVEKQAHAVIGELNVRIDLGN